MMGVRSESMWSNELQKRELRYVLDVKSATSEEVQPERPEWKGIGRPPKPRYTPTNTDQ